MVYDPAPAFARPIIALALVSLVWLSSLAQARAAPITDTFQLRLTGSRRSGAGAIRGF